MRCALAALAVAASLATGAHAQETTASAEVSGEPVIGEPRPPGEFTTLPDLINPADIEQEITDLERQRLEIERQRLEAQEHVERAQRSIEREEVDLGTYGYNLEVTQRRLQDLITRTEAKQARIELYRSRMRRVLAPLTLGSASAVGPAEVAGLAAARRYARQIAILDEDLTALQSEVAALQRYRRREHELIGLANRNIGEHSERLDLRQATLEQIRLEMASGEARLDALLDALETATPSVLLPQASIAAAASASIELPLPGPPPEHSPVASASEEASAEVIALPPPEETTPEIIVEASPEDEALDASYRSIEEIARAASEELDLGEPIPIDMEAFAGTQGLAIGTAGEGLEIETPAGATIRAPRPGEAVYTGPLEGYGNVVILQHGDDSLAVFASVASVEVEAGDSVDFGTPIARAGTLRESGAPGFHFEVRRGGETIDPIEWLGEDALRAAMVAPEPDEETP